MNLFGNLRFNHVRRQLVHLEEFHPSGQNSRYLSSAVFEACSRSITVSPQSALVINVLSLVHYPGEDCQKEVIPLSSDGWLPLLKGDGGSAY